MKGNTSYDVDPDARVGIIGGWVRPVPSLSGESYLIRKFGHIEKIPAIVFSKEGNYSVTSTTWTDLERLYIDYNEYEEVRLLWRGSNDTSGETTSVRLYCPYYDNVICSESITSTSTETADSGWVSVGDWGTKYLEINAKVTGGTGSIETVTIMGRRIP